MCKLCICLGLQKLNYLRSEAPKCYIYSTFVKINFFNSKTGEHPQRPVNRNYKGRGFEKHNKHSAFGNSVFAASDIVGCVTIVLFEKARYLLRSSIILTKKLDKLNKLCANMA